MRAATLPLGLALACLVNAPLTACKEKVSAPPQAPADAPTPKLEPVTRYVTALSAVRYRECTAMTRPSGRLAIGTKVEVEADPTVVKGRQMYALTDGGCIDGRRIAEQPPRATEALTAAHAALSAGHLEEAAEEARRAEVLDAKDPRPLRLLAAIHDATGDVEQAKRVYAALKTHPAAPPLPAAPAWAASSSVSAGPAFVAATILNLRAAPKRGATVKRVLRINDRVTVTALDGEWARVDFEPVARLRVLSSSVAKTLMPDGRVLPQRPLGEQAETAAPTREAKVDGWVAQRFLRSEALDHEDQLARAKELEIAGDLEGAIVYLERAARLNRADTSVLGRLVALALKTQRNSAAVWAAQQVNARRLDAEVSLAVAYGCREGPIGAWVPESRWGYAPDAVCVIDVDVAEICEPQYANGPDEVSYEGDDFERAVREYEGSEQARLDEEDNEALAAEYDAEVEARRTRLEGLGVSSPPRLAVTIHGPADARARQDRLFLYSFDTALDAECAVIPASGDITVYPEPIPWPAPGETLTVIADLPRYDGSVHGILTATSSEQAIEMLRRPTPDVEWAKEPFAAGVYRRIPHAQCPGPCGC